MRPRAARTEKRTTGAAKKRRAAAVKDVVVPAKISVPRLVGTYQRVRLFRSFDDAMRRRVVWIAAPAGAGKTSAVMTYLEARALPALWYNVDARDVDVANLFHYLAMAARLAAHGQRPLLPAFAVENQTGIAAFARGFFEALGAARPSPSAIVFDDYHDARSELLDEVMREALFSLPRGITAIIISRSEAPPWLARLIAAGDVATVGIEDLRFTAQEIEGLVRIHCPDLRGTQLKTMLPQIVELANGWAASLTLLLQSRRLSSAETFGMEEFSERLFDYFATEILDEASVAQREFLFKTAVVPRFTAALAVELTGHEEINGVMCDLEKRSFLLQRLGDSGHYRYHPLLRGFLLRRAKDEFGATALTELHRRAGHLLVDQGLADDAMEQFQTSNDVEAVAQLVLHLAPAYIANGHGRTIENWIHWLPPTRVDSDGWLLHWEGVSCLAYAPSRSRVLLERAFAIFSQQKDAAGLYSCCAGAIQAVTFEATDHGRCDVWLDRVDLLQLEGPACPEPIMPALSTAMLLGSIFRRPEPPDDPVWAKRAMALAAASDDIAHRVTTGGFLALRSVLHEDLDRATIILEMLRDSAKAAQYSTLSTLPLLLSDAISAWGRGDNAVAIVVVREALALAHRSGVFAWNDHLCAIGLSSAFTAEDFDSAHEFLMLNKKIAEHGKVFAVGCYYFYASWDAFLAGDYTRALRLQDLGLEAGDALGFPLSLSITRFAKAQILWKMGQKEDARRSMASARAYADRAGYGLMLFGCDLVDADHEWDENRELALRHLRNGLAIGREKGFYNTFWLGRATLTRAAVRALEYGVETAYARSAILKHRLTSPDVPLSADAWPFRYRMRALGVFEITTTPEPPGANAREASNDAHGVLRGMPRRLLQAIVAYGGRGVRDVHLIDALWPDAEGDAGRRVFDTTLHRLRRQLGGDSAVRLTDSCVYLDDRTCWLDVWALERALAESDRQLTQRAPMTTLAPLAEHLLALYRGPLLAEQQEGFVNGPRMQLARKFRAIAERLATVLEPGGLKEQAELLRQRAAKVNHG